MPIKVETSPFAMFPAQADYANTEHENREALRALLPWAATTQDLRKVAEALGIIEPPARPVLCLQGHDQAESGSVRSNGRRYCMACKRDQERARYQRNKATA